MTHTPTTTIPRCWQRHWPLNPGFHAWGSIGDCCRDWWVRRSERDPRTAYDCRDRAPHDPHLWLEAGNPPPQPYTMWRCGGIRE